MISSQPAQSGQPGGLASPSTRAHQMKPNLPSRCRCDSDHGAPELSEGQEHQVGGQARDTAGQLRASLLTGAKC